MVFKSNNSAQVKSAQITQKNAAPAQENKQPNSEATERLRRYVESSERFQRSVYGQKSK